MPFVKGDKNIYRKGRPKGAVDNDKRKIRIAIDKLLDDVNIVELYESQKTPKDKANLLTGLMEFSIPKLNRTESRTEHTGSIIVRPPEDVN